MSRTSATVPRPDWPMAFREWFTTVDPDSKPSRDCVLHAPGSMSSTQARVPGLGHQDLLVNDRIALEIDGETWHGADQFEADRERDLHAARLGRRTIRLTSHHVLDQWPDTLTAIERALADDSRVHY